MATKMRKVKSFKKSKSKSKSKSRNRNRNRSRTMSRGRKSLRKYRRLRLGGGCENCTDYHGSGSPAPQWTQGSQAWFKGGSHEPIQMINDDIFKHGTDPSFYSSTK